jgi:4-amino-4-deoxy-L-arabinose transferase-like glycosyltransferase
MTTSTVDADSSTNSPELKYTPPWLTLLTYIAALFLLGLALYLRIHNLGLLYDRDGYDEGVYWQSLRAMSAGKALYSQIFYSQPPFFLLSVFPFYMLFGQTLWAARLGIALLSLTGLVGAFFLGRALAGRIGAIAAVLLLTFDPLFLAQSQTIQAEAPSTALSFLALGLAYAWWTNPEGLSGVALAILCSISLVLSISCKLLGVVTLIPIVIIMGMQLWRVLRNPATPISMRRSVIRSILFGALAFVLTALVVFLPFISAFTQLWQGMVTFHTDAGHFYKGEQIHNFDTMHGLLTSIIALTALVGTILALWRKDWRVFPLLAWLIATIVMLWSQVPLFHHHLVALIPPLISLAVINLDPRQWQNLKKVTPLKVASLLGIVLLLISIGMNAWGVKTYFADKRTARSSGLNQQIPAVASDVRAATLPDQYVITDAQFIVGAANRNTPPALVDTSLVRAATGYVTLQQLIQEAQSPQVKAVLFYSGRFDIQQLAPFRQWVATRFHLLKDYGEGRQLWVKD